MTPRDFCVWLKGYLEISADDPVAVLTGNTIDKIYKKLEEVLAVEETKKNTPVYREADAEKMIREAIPKNPRTWPTTPLPYQVDPFKYNEVLPYPNSPPIVTCSTNIDDLPIC